MADEIIMIARRVDEKHGKFAVIHKTLVIRPGGGEVNGILRRCETWRVLLEQT